jgi:hypothetical protein
MADKTHAKGAALLVDVAGGTTFVEIADVVAIKPPNKTRGTGETTVLKSTNSYREFLPGFKDGGELTIKLRFAKEAFEDLDDAFESDVISNWKITLTLLSGEATATNWIAKAIITDLSVPEASADNEDIWEVDVTLKITGKPAYTKGAA